MLELVDAAIARWAPAPVTCIDVASSGGHFGIVEANCFNAARFYAADAPHFGGQGVVKVPKGGGAIAVVANENQAWGVAVHGESIYWTSRLVNGAVRRATVAGTDVVALGTGQQFPWSIVRSGDYVYWSTWVNGTIARVQVQ